MLPLASRIAVNTHFGFKSGSILADAQPLIANVSAPRRFAQIALGLVRSDVLRRIEAGKVLADDFVRRCTL